MLTVNVKVARSSFSRLIDRVQQGESTIITRHGEKAAMIVPVEAGRQRLPSLRSFRSRIGPEDVSLSVSVLEERGEGRY